MEQKIIVTTRSELQEIIKEVIQANTTPNNPVIDDDYLTQTEAARFLRISKVTLIEWKKKGAIPYYQQGKTVLYKKTELLETLKKNPKLNKE